MGITSYGTLFGYIKYIHLCGQSLGCGPVGNEDIDIGWNRLLRLLLFGLIELEQDSELRTHEQRVDLGTGCGKTIV